LSIYMAMSTHATESARRGLRARLASLLATVPPDRRPRRFAQLIAGLLLYGVTASMLVLAGLGLDPWDVLHQGLSRTFGLGIGTWAIIVSVFVLFAWWPLRQRLGVGTVMNALFVGLTIDVILSLFGPPHALGLRIALLVGGVIGNGIATGLYIGAGLGPGPRDGLSVGIAGRPYSSPASCSAARWGWERSSTRWRSDRSRTRRSPLWRLRGLDRVLAGELLHGDPP
jgi:hypothetical protein